MHIIHFGRYRLQLLISSASSPEELVVPSGPVEYKSYVVVLLLGVASVEDINTKGFPHSSIIILLSSSSSANSIYCFEAGSEGCNAFFRSSISVGSGE
jgi:hypothetical protein